MREIPTPSKPDERGELLQIEEVEAEIEQTSKSAPQRKSQVIEEEAGQPEFNVAINEQEEDESMQLDAAFMNDKRNLK